jgi:CheY-like chemotaxis protein
MQVPGHDGRRPTRIREFQTAPPHADVGATRAVLVVDDVEATRPGLAELLRMRGYAPYQAKNGAEGIEVLHEHLDTRVVVLALTMPGMSGFWLREQQPREPALARVPGLCSRGQRTSKN